VAAGLRSAGAATAVPLYWERVAVCWRLAADHGLAMAALMRAAQTDIIERQRFADRLNAALAGARATSGILAMLPFLGILLGQLIGAEPLRFLLGDGAGGWLLILGAVLIAAGLLWADRITETRTS
jgi:tight adherence protein B